MRVAVIGAGAAGISAARELTSHGLDVRVFEARDRIGGRAWTDTTLVNHPVELGAEFVHGERVPTWDWLREFDAGTTGAAHAYTSYFQLGGSLADRATARSTFGCEPMTATYRLARRWRAQDRGAASIEQTFELWPLISDQPLTDEIRRFLSNYIAELVASDSNEVGIPGPAPAPAGYQPETLTNFRILAGYSALMAQAAAGLEIQLGAAITRVRREDSSVELTLANGQTERFDAAIVTLPLGVLADGVVEFNPPLSTEKRDAIRRINRGHISKVVLVFDQVLWPEDLCFLWSTERTQLWWRPGQGQANEAPVLTAFFGGSAAGALEGAPEEEAVALATDELGNILGQSLTKHRLRGCYIAWGAEPHTRMGYSSLPPGGEGLRELLAAPEGLLFFAGEATSVHSAATVHGAIESGRRAARELLSARSEGS
ncbi:hypothetical protein AYO38_01780 [bacterium SCGC AG-212-C10]|nr:hypothetical protein AYO38_01780 [bacterium SCGC AG-212-C10]